MLLGDAREEGAIMNTIGKVLVLLNLVFALATGAFLVVDFTKRRDWQSEAEHRKSLILTAQSGRDAALGELKSALAENKKLKEQLDGYLIDRQGEIAKLQIQIEDRKKALEKEKTLAAEAGQNALKSDAEAKRLQKEVELLTGLVTKREEEIRNAQKIAADLQNLALTKSAEAQSTKERNRNLLEQLKVAQVRIADLEKGPTGIKTTSVRDPNYTNPPAAYVKGKIAKIDSQDRSLVELNIGSDVGVNKDNTLDVYRLNPRAAYLGRLLIVDSYPHKAIGRLVRRNGVSAPPLQVGDEVASQIR